MINPVVHWEIGGHHPVVLREFYQRAFGWRMIEAGPGHSLVPAAAEGIGGGIRQVREDHPPYVTIYVEVDDLAEKLARIAQLGGTMLVPPTEISPAMSFAMFADPEGNVVGLLHQTDAMPQTR